MALSAAMRWEARTGGNAANSGGFKLGASGTDYSQQPSAQFSVTDLAIDAVHNTKVTSATISFDATSPGNTLIVSAGAGFTTGTYEILSVAAGVATLDRAVGTTSSTGGTAKLGGAKSHPIDVDTIIVPGNICWVESGSYPTHTATKTFTCDGSLAGGDIWFIGYPAGGSRTNQDITEASMPVFTSATNSVDIFTTNAANFLGFRNFKLTHTAATRGKGFTNGTGGTNNATRFVNCITDGCSWGFYFGNGASTTVVGVSTIFCTARNGTSGGMTFLQGQNASFVHGCYIADCAGPGITVGQTGTAIWFVCSNTIIDSMTGGSGYGIQVTCTTASTNTAGFHVTDCVFWTNAQAGIRYDYTTGRMPTHFVANCLFISNKYGQQCATSGIIDGTQMTSRNNAYYNNTSGALSNVAAGDNDVTLTGDPFTSPGGSADFSLNNTAGAGADCRSAGYPSRVGALGATAGTGYKDIGPLQAQPSAGGGTVAYGFAG